MRLKPINEQVVVILGASSGIGRECALRFAYRGAKVFAAARSEPALDSLVRDIRSWGGLADYAVCDVADFDQVKDVASAAVRAFGRIDTWVNDAGVLVSASFEDTSPEEFRRVMEVNYLGQVHGAKAALPHLRRAGGGALISISSVEAVVSLPLHSAYAASKHAVEGMIDALRRELMAEGAPISVTSVKPATINTPLFDNSLDKLGVKPKGPPPVYQPSVVADCVLYAAENPVRDLYAGGAARMMTMGQMLAPSLVDAGMARFGIAAQRTDEPEPVGASNNLYEPRAWDNRVEGDFGDQARERSLYTWMETHPKARALAAAGAIAGAAVLLSQARGDGTGNGQPADEPATDVSQGADDPVAVGWVVAEVELDEQYPI